MVCLNPDVQQPIRTRSHQMWPAAWIVTAVFMLSNSATPLYVRWQLQMEFSEGTLTAVFTAYIVGLLAALLVAGQLSDRFGRKRVLLPGLLAALAASLLFASATSVTMLVAGRFLTGVSVGVIVSAGMAAVVDFGGHDNRRTAALAASTAMVMGAGLGPLVAGSMAATLEEPIVPTFFLVLAVLISALVVAFVLPFIRIRADSSKPWQFRLPTVPRSNWRHLALGVVVFAPGLTSTSFVLSLGPSLLSKLLAVPNPLVAGILACAMFVAATGVQFAVKGFSVRTILLLGAGATVISMCCFILSVSQLLLAPLIGAALLAGIGQGLGQLGGLTLIGLHVPVHNRAEGNALLNIGAYIPAGLLPLSTGFLANWVGLGTATVVFAIVVALSASTGATFVGVKMRSIGASS